MKKFHDALKTIYGPKSSGATTLLSADGNTLLTDKKAILKRWAEHFSSVLYRHQASMRMQSTDFQRKSEMFYEMNFQPS